MTKYTMAMAIADIQADRLDGPATGVRATAAVRGHDVQETREAARADGPGVPL